MRNKAYELHVHDDLKDAELQSYLEAAERRQTKGRAYQKGDRIEAEETVFLLDGLIKLGQANIIIGQPKVGKSSFSTGLIRALRERRAQFLGRDFALPSAEMPVLLFGTDQSDGDWLHLLKREKLVDERTNDSQLDFFCSMQTGEEYNFTKDGIRHMKEEIDKYQFPLVIIDSLSSMMEPTGIEENTSRFAQPIRNAISRLSETGATIVVIHHSVKRPTTWDWITECRGSSSISSVFSWGVLMRWVASEEDGLARTDRRVGFTGKGRGSNEAGGVMAEYMDADGWTVYGGLEEAQQVERVKQRIAELGGVRAQVFDYLTARTEIGADVSVDEIATTLNKEKSAASRELRILKSKGLADVVREEATGHRPRPFWALSSSAQKACDVAPWVVQESAPNALNVFNAEPLSYKNNKNMYIKTQETETLGSQGMPNNIPHRTPVEVLKGDTWSNGYVIRDSSNPDSVTVEKVGNPMITISNLRSYFDVRPCASAFAASNSGSTVPGGEPPLLVHGSVHSVLSDEDPVSRHDGPQEEADRGDQESVGTQGQLCTPGVGEFPDF